MSAADIKYYYFEGEPKPATCSKRARATSEGELSTSRPKNASTVIRGRGKNQLAEARLSPASFQNQGPSLMFTAPARGTIEGHAAEPAVVTAGSPALRGMESNTSPRPRHRFSASDAALSVNCTWRSND